MITRNVTDLTRILSEVLPSRFPNDPRPRELARVLAARGVLAFEGVNVLETGAHVAGFEVRASDVPPGEVWFIQGERGVVGKITGLGHHISHHAETKESGK